MVSVTDTNVAGGKRPGRPRKDNKRPALSLRINPELRQRLVAMAEENGRSITQQTELLLEQAVNGLDRGDSSSQESELRLERSQDLASCLFSLGIWSYGIGGKQKAAYQEFYSICIATLARPGPRRRGRNPNG